jgi:hypothetical protein
LRGRHAFCITQSDIYRDVREGRIPHYDPDRHRPYCACPDDEVCAAPGVPDELIETEIRLSFEESAEMLDGEDNS